MTKSLNRAVPGKSPRVRRQLPNLSALEGNFQYALSGVICQRLHFRIENLDPFSHDRRQKMRAVFHPLLAFLTENHRRENLDPKVYRTFVRLVKLATLYIYIYICPQKPKKEEPMNRDLLEKPFTPEQIKRRQGTN